MATVKSLVELTETYKNVLCIKDFRVEDHERLAFLHQIADGAIVGETRDGIFQIGIEKALARMEAIDPASETTSKLRAANALRQWYLNPGNVSKSEIEEALREANVKYMDGYVPECLAVLKRYRVRALSAIFDAAFNAEEGIREQAVYATAETLLNSGHKELANYAITKMAEWQRTASASQSASRAA
ncbi:MAG TPA: hypothetical protein VI612_00460 [Candidatus Nanoarchaeia archaeon]|nr:hypothetical protein [Candidatus Nanoarchaeia archaeon]